MIDKLFNTRNMSIVLDHVSDGIQVIDREGKLIYCNRRAAVLDDINIEQSLGRHIMDIYTSLSPETSTLLKVLETKSPIFNMEQTYVTYKGNKVTTLNSTLPITYNGELIGAMEISQNITDVKALSERVVDLQNKVFSHVSKDYKEEAVYNFRDIITGSREMNRVKSIAMRIAPTDAPVLVFGETGTGKELLVQAIHNNSARRSKSFIAQNCAALPSTLLEGILFGTMKGGFTGSVDRKGLFELADGGTLFLDEINSMPLELQAKLLRVLQEGAVRRIGDTKMRTVNVRVIAATNVEPEEAVNSGALRRDLLYRLNTLSFELPRLVERQGDIELLTQFFIKKYNDRLYRDVKGITPEAMAYFLNYTWPGNVRELEHIIEGAMHIVDGHWITEEYLPNSMKRSLSQTELVISESESLAVALERTERKLLEQAMIQTEHNISKAAKILDVPRQTLQYKIKKYGLKV
ncbi:MAG: sigma 54-interacting transcriptional regulator [Clostridia bacterium]|nr:sigma 54-interacting transcriptional regulator [Clostridia bacterium]